MLGVIITFVCFGFMGWSCWWQVQQAKERRRRHEERLAAIRSRRFWPF